MKLVPLLAVSLVFAASPAGAFSWTVTASLDGCAGDPLGHHLGDEHVTSGSFSGSALTTISEADEVELLAGLWYFNIHSTFKTGGEIRGQVYLVPEPTTLGLLALGLAGLAWTGRRRI